MFKNKGFTLAEVLITLTIIGVVAALTVPNLYAYYQKQQYVTQLKKVYTEISQAIKLMMADESINKLTASNTLTYDDVSDWNEFIQGVGDNFLKKYFKVIKDCGTEVSNDCFASAGSCKKITGDMWGEMPSCLYSIVTVSGASICFVTVAGEFHPGAMMVDINGLKPPNTAGRDLFMFSYYYDGSIDESATPECRKGVFCNGGQFGVFDNPNDLRQTRFENLCSNYGAGCFGKILNDNWKMDY